MPHSALFRTFASSLLRIAVDQSSHKGAAGVALVKDEKTLCIEGGDPPKAIRRPALTEQEYEAEIKVHTAINLNSMVSIR